MTAVLYTPHFAQFFDNNGDPLAGGLLHTYAAGTTTPKATYTTEAGDIQHDNPIVLDSSGRTTLWLIGSYKFVLHDSNDNPVDDGTTDNVTAFTATADAADAFYQSFSGTGSQTAFTLSENLGTDEKTIMVYVDQGLRENVTNGTFDSDTAWTKGAGWTIAAGVATATGAISTALSQTAPVTLIAGQAYSVVYTITRSAGGLIPSIGGQNGTERTASGTYREVIVAGSTQTIAFTGNAFTGTLDVVSVTPADGKGFDIQSPTSYTLNGTSLSFTTAPAIGTNNIQVWAPARLANAAAASASAADASATAAGVSAAAALVSENNAETAEINAEAAETNAEIAQVIAEAAAVTAIAAAGTAAVGNLNSLSVGVPVSGDFLPFVDISDSNLAKKVAIGTSGSTIGLLNANKTDSGNNTYSGTSAFTANTFFRNSGSTVQIETERTDSYSGGSLIARRRSLGENGSTVVAQESIFEDILNSQAKYRVETIFGGALATAFEADAGMAVGSPTGGIPTTRGHLNAVSYRVNNVTQPIYIGSAYGTISGSVLTVSRQNLGTLARSSSGVFTWAFTSAEADVNYHVSLTTTRTAGTAVSDVCIRNGTKATSGFTIETGATGGTFPGDPDALSLMIWRIP